MLPCIFWVKILMVTLGWVRHILSCSLVMVVIFRVTIVFQRIEEVY